MTARTESLERIRNIALAVGAVGVIAAIIGLITDRETFFHAYLIGFAFVAEVGVGCLFLLMINHVTGGHWGIPIRALLEAGSELVVAAALLFIPLLFGLPYLYAWAQPEAVSADPLLQHQSLYLNPTFFTVRSVIYFAVWIFLAWRMTRPEADKRTWAVIGLILHFPLATLAAIDWFMSLQPHWTSTIFGVVFLAGQALTAYGFVVVMLRLLPTPSPEEADQQTRQDLGNVLLTIIIVATYLQFIQFLVIWAGDLPDETSFYLARTAGGWTWVALFLILVDIVIPFVLLLSRGVKTHLRRLALVALMILVSQYLYVYWLVLPAFNPNGATVDWLSLILPLGMCGVWTAAFTARLQAAMGSRVRLGEP